MTEKIERPEKAGITPEEHKKLNEEVKKAGGFAGLLKKGKTVACGKIVDIVKHKASKKKSK